MKRTRSAQFWEMVSRDEHPDGCWIWTGKQFSSWVDGHKLRIQEAAWVLGRYELLPMNARVTAGCGHGRCVRPDHLVAAPMPRTRRTMTVSIKQPGPSSQFLFELRQRDAACHLAEHADPSNGAENAP